MLSILISAQMWEQALKACDKRGQPPKAVLSERRAQMICFGSPVFSDTKASKLEVTKRTEGWKLHSFAQQILSSTGGAGTDVDASPNPTSESPVLKQITMAPHRGGLEDHFLIFLVPWQRGPEGSKTSFGEVLPTMLPNLCSLTLTPPPPKASELVRSDVKPKTLTQPAVNEIENQRAFCWKEIVGPAVV